MQLTLFLDQNRMKHFRMKYLILYVIISQSSFIWYITKISCFQIKWHNYIFSCLSKLLHLKKKVTINDKIFELETRQNIIGDIVFLQCMNRLKAPTVCSVYIHTAAASAGLAILFIRLLSAVTGDALRGLSKSVHKWQQCHISMTSLPLI